MEIFFFLWPIGKKKPKTQTCCCNLNLCESAPAQRPLLLESSLSLWSSAFPITVWKHTLGSFLTHSPSNHYFINYTRCPLRALTGLLGAVGSILSCLLCRLILWASETSRTICWALEGCLRHCYLVKSTNDPSQGRRRGILFSFGWWYGLAHYRHACIPGHSCKCVGEHRSDRNVS